VTDYDTMSGALEVRHGKGRQQRIVYATNGSRAALDACSVFAAKQPARFSYPRLATGGCAQQGG